MKIAFIVEIALIAFIVYGSLMYLAESSQSFTGAINTAYERQCDAFDKILDRGIK